MRVVCAWCDGVIGGRGSIVTHGICGDCSAKVFEPQFDFMESLPAAELARRARRRRSAGPASGPITAQRSFFWIRKTGGLGSGLCIGLLQNLEDPVEGRVDVAVVAEIRREPAVRVAS